MKILVLGIGNDILHDDGVGPAVVRELRHLDCPFDVFLATTNLSGFPLLDLVTGYDILIIVDAIKSERNPGEIIWAQSGDFSPLTHTYSQHNMDILRMLELGKQMGICIPSNIRIMAIEAYDVTSFGEFLTPAVADIVPEAAAKLMQQIILLKKESLTAGRCHSVSTRDIG
jgi:hydrogenase maturation protease